jgi:3-oxoadipate enol-lactonase
MPVIDADGCPLWVEVEGPQQGAGPRSVEFARHRPAHVGRAGGVLRGTLPPGALRSARPRQIRRDRLILSNTSCHYPDKRFWDERIAAIRASGGLASLADRILGLWFSQEFRARAPATVAPLKTMLAATQVEGYIACCGAIRDMDHRDLLPRITAPTLVIAGRGDQATPVAAAQFIHSRIPGAALTILEAAHISNVEQPTLYADEVLRFLTRRAA